MLSGYEHVNPEEFEPHFLSDGVKDIASTRIGSAARIFLLCWLVHFSHKNERQHAFDAKTVYQLNEHTVMNHSQAD